MKNNHLTTLVTELKRLAITKERPLWKRIASDLEKPTRRRRTINLWNVEQHAKDGEIVVVPGKVLGDGTLTKKVTVAAYAYSTEAKKKLAAAGGTALSIEELIKKQPDGKGIRILG